MPSETAVRTKTQRMADGLNEARALRVTEILNHYQHLQRCIAHTRIDPPTDELNGVGYTTLRQCHEEARALLNKAYPPEMLQPLSGSHEAEKRQLQRVITDATARRFEAQKILLRASAAVVWVQSRNAILGGPKPQSGHLPALRQVDTTLRNELGAINDEKIINGFRAADQQAGYWLHDDPPLQTVLSWMNAHP